MNSFTRNTAQKYSANVFTAKHFRRTVRTDWFCLFFSLSILYQQYGHMSRVFLDFFIYYFLPQKHRLRAAVYLIIHALPCIFHSCREACIFFCTDILPDDCGYCSSAFLCSLHNYLFRMLCLFLCCVGRIRKRIAYAEFFVFRDCQRMIRQCFDTLYI